MSAYIKLFKLMTQKKISEAQSLTNQTLNDETGKNINYTKWFIINKKL